MRGVQARREGREGRSSSSTTAGASPDHRRSLAGPPPEFHHTTISRPDVQARRATEGLTFRPNVLLKARLSGLMSSSEALTFFRSPHLRQRPSPSSEALTFARGPHFYQRHSPSPKALTNT
ncbi:hypothetical protein MA16_Dca014839 [Dendrobium catenatum]|uniref:Uncharacterized protein n=1 Tax=Dendrobium catenatum TaxID=906689 RepID=A0A2I0XB69_9ASPA|nr:hypothetical protein MA16_Dca014839 [Dendrobium catenatum]